MLLLALFSWWYTAGWAKLTRGTVLRLAATLDFFSIELLLKSLFAPFRQISVGRVQGPLDVQLRAWADRQISRLIGAMVRTAVIIFGLLAIAFMLVFAVVVLLLWPLVPLLPVVVLVAAGGLS